MSRRIRHDPRPLNADERELLEWLLAHAKSDNLRSVDALSRSRVIGGCGCGCPSLDFEIDAPNIRRQIISDVVGISPESVLCGLILFATETAIDNLEVYSYGASTRFSLPRTRDLRTFDEYRGADEFVDEAGVVRARSFLSG